MIGRGPDPWGWLRAVAITDVLVASFLVAAWAQERAVEDRHARRLDSYEIVFELRPRMAPTTTTPEW